VLSALKSPLWGTSDTLETLGDMQKKTKEAIEEFKKEIKKL